MLTPIQLDYILIISMTIVCHYFINKRSLFLLIKGLPEWEGRPQIKKYIKYMSANESTFRDCAHKSLT